MLRHRLHAAATAVVMWPLQALDDLIYAWHQRRDRHLHRELREAAAAYLAVVTAELLVSEMYRVWYSPDVDTAPQHRITM